MAVKSVPMPKFNPTPEQAAIFDFVKNEQANGVVEALAGTGKTTTQVQSFNKMRTRGRKFGALAFNKSIAEELVQRLPRGVWSGTFHSRGRSMLTKIPCKGAKKLRLEGRKYYWMAKQASEKIGADLGREEIGDVVKAIEFGRILQTKPLNKLEAEEWGPIETYLRRRGISLGEKTMDVISRATVQGMEEFEETGLIDFQDMISYPMWYDMLTDAEKFEILMVDECQDLNRAQQEFAIRSGHRLVCVGDRHQSIYGFRGADVKSFDRLGELLSPSYFPLTVTQRCPWAIVELAKQIVPSLRAKLDAKQGEILHVNTTSMLQFANPGDLIICRTNAPLAEALFALWREGKRAKIIGKDMSKEILNLVNKIGFDSQTSFLSKLRDYRETELHRLEEIEASASAKLYVEDITWMIEMIVTSVCSFADLKQTLERMFSEDTGEPFVRLSTVHRAKGLEADSVYILKPESIPHPMAEEEWEKEQEMNLAYVAVTRSRNRLTFCGSVPPAFDIF